MPSFKIIGLLFLEKKIFKGFAIYRHGGHLGHVTLAIYINFNSPFLTMLHIKFGFDWPNNFREHFYKHESSVHLHTNSKFPPPFDYILPIFPIPMI